MKSYKTLLKPAHFEQGIERSRFIGSAFAIESAEQAPLLLEKTRLLYPGASHYCFAWVAGDQNEHQRLSDDKEPAGTAGLPILQALKSFDLRYALLIVTRYYGGTKLGSAGLLRAYSQTAAQTLKNASLAKSVVVVPLLLTMRYPLYAIVQHWLLESGLSYEEPSFTDTVSLLLYSPVETAEKDQKTLRELTAGQIDIKPQRAMRRLVAFQEE